MLNNGAVFVATAVLPLGSEAVKEAVAAVLEAVNLKVLKMKFPRIIKSSSLKRV